MSKFQTLKSLLTDSPESEGDDYELAAEGQLQPLPVRELDRDDVDPDDYVGQAPQSMASMAYGEGYDEDNQPTAEELLEHDYAQEVGQDDEVSERQRARDAALQLAEEQRASYELMAQQYAGMMAQMAAAPLPEIPPPVARFANLVTYEGSFEPLKHQVGHILTEAMNEVMRLRARAAEAFERQVEDVLADLACTVLGRELTMTPADLQHIVEQMRMRMGSESAVSIRVSPEDAPNFHVPVMVDEQLQYGDLMFDLEDGQIDLRLGTRLDALLRERMVQL